MTVQQIVSAVSMDMRQVLSDQAPDANIIVPWVDRIQKDILHTSVFNYLLNTVQTITTTVGNSTYGIDPDNTAIIRQIISVYDRNLDRDLIPFGKVTEGLSLDKSIPAPMISAETMTQWPVYYRRDGANGLILYPAPAKAPFAGAYEVQYEKGAPTLSALSDVLLIPDDATDMIVAGVNMLASSYLKNLDESQRWQGLYEAMKGK